MDIPFFSKSLKKSLLRGTYIFDFINGIICLGDETNGYIFWNPVIREYKVLPNLPFHICHPFNTIHGDTFAFGYDHNSNDYKVVQIVTYSRDNILHPVVHVYNLRTDSWRQGNTTFDPSIIHFPLYFSNEIYLNGVHRWIGCSRNKHKGIKRISEIIVSFDMRDEVFHTISMPNLGDTWPIRYISKTLSVLSNCLTLIFLQYTRG